MDERIFLVASINIRGRSLWSNGVAPFNILKCLEIHFLEEFFLSRIKKQTCIRLAKIELMFVCILYVSWTEDFLRIPWSNESFEFCSYLFLIQSEEEGKVTSLFDNDSIFVYKFETKHNEFILQRSINQ